MKKILAILGLVAIIAIISFVVFTKSSDNTKEEKTSIKHSVQTEEQGKDSEEKEPMVFYNTETGELVKK